MILSPRHELLIAGAVAALAALAFIGTLAHALLLPTTDTETVASSTAAALPRAAPVRIRIPALAIDAPVEDVGIAPSGRMAVPRSYTGTGWRSEERRVGKECRIGV